MSRPGDSLAAPGPTPRPAPSVRRVHAPLLRERRQVGHRAGQRPQARRVGGERHRAGRARAPQEELRLLPQQLPGRRLPLPGSWALPVGSGAGPRPPAFPHPGGCHLWVSMEMKVVADKVNSSGERGGELSGDAAACAGAGLTAIDRGVVRAAL